MTESSPGYRYTAAALIGLALLMGAWLRFSGLQRRSISHPEMYIPGIPLPDGLSEPAPRMTFSRILTGTFSSDTHPPGYYLLMLPWTRAVGTSLRAIRLPSALLGLASIPLLFWLAWLAGWRLAGGVAATLLAVSGYHVFWSQVARMFPLTCFLGLASSVTLLLVTRGSRYRSLLTAVYVVLILAGVSCHVFFWSLFAIQVLWALGNAWGQSALPDLCRAQLLALVLGSPLIAFAAYQSGNTVADLSGNALLFLAEFLPFAFALPSSHSGFFADAVPFTGSAAFLVARAGLVAIAAVLLATAVWNLWKRPSKSHVFLPSSPVNAFWRLGWIAAAILATAAIAGFVYMTRQLPPAQIRETIRLTKALTILPLTIMAAAFLLDWGWARLPRPGRWKRFVDGERCLLVLLGIGPFALLAILAQFRPILNQRGLLFASPYLLLLLSIGLVHLRTAWIAVLAPILVLMCVASSVAYHGMTVDPADYARFAATLQSEIRPTDLVFVRKAWYETPIFYYLQPDRYRLVGRDYASFCAGDPQARVWVVMLYDDAPASDMETSLSRYKPTKTISAPHAKAILYVPQPPKTSSSAMSDVSKPLKIRRPIRISTVAGGNPARNSDQPDLARGVRGRGIVSYGETTTEENGPVCLLKTLVRFRPQEAIAYEYS